MPKGYVFYIAICQFALNIVYLRQKEVRLVNVINVKIDFTRGICYKQGISVVTGDYNSTKVVFEFDESAETGTKVFEMKNPSGELVYADQIVNNEVILVGTKENEQHEGEIVSLFNEEGDYTFEVSLYGNDSKLTSVCGYITAHKEEVVVDGEEVQQELTLFDNLMNELNEAITETNNLDIDAEKVEHTTTITITKKDGTEETVEILDGETPTLEFDDTPTEGSTNPVTSTGIKNYVDNIVGNIESILTTLDIGSGVNGN